MGYQLTREVEALGVGGRLAGLSTAALACLWVMAANAHDTGTKTTPARVYFRGWDHLAMCALGVETYDESARRRMVRPIGQLVDAGLIKPVGRRHGNRHGRAMYELTLMWG